MDSKVFWLVMLVGFAIVVFVVFLTNNPVWQERRVALESLRTSSDEARDAAASQSPYTAGPAKAPPNSAPVIQTQPPARTSPYPTQLLPQPDPNPAAQTQPQQKNEQPQTAAEALPKATKPAAEQSAASMDRPGERYSPIDLFFRDYEMALEEINDESEPERQEEICRDASRRIDEDLRTQTWEFNCLVLKVETLPDHLFNISHQAPDEVDLVPDGWAVLDKAASIPLLQLANKQQIFKGDYIVYVGTPRFDTVLVDSESGNRRGEYSNLTNEKKVRPLSATQIPDAKYFYCSIEIGGTAYNQTLHLANVNVKFLRGSDNIARTNWQQKAQQQSPTSRVPQQIGSPRQQVLAQTRPYSNSAATSGSEVINQYNNYYSSSHPYYLYPEWVTFYRVHHFHHAHEHEPDYVKCTMPAASTAAATKVQLPVRQAPVRQPTPPQRSSSATARAPVKPPPMQMQPKK